jgi:hypothetical protein
MANLRAQIFADAFVDELDEFMVVPTDTQRPVLGVYQLDRGMHDRSQRFVEFEPGRDYQHGLDQTIQPIAAFDYLLDPVLDLHEQLAESQLG